MEYKRLAEFYEEVSKTPKRLEKIEITSKFLRKIHKDDKEVLYLMLGDIYPEYDGRKIGISHQLVIKALAKTTGINSKKIVKEWKTLGDLGEVAKKLTGIKEQSTLTQNKILTTDYVLKNMRKLPELEGKGTVDKKMSLITELLISASPLEATYLIRTLIGDLRIGLKENTIRSAIASSFFGRTKESEEAVQTAVDKSNDLATVFEIATEGDFKKLGKISLEIGKPIKAMLAQKTKTIKEGFEALGKPCACLPKEELIFSNPSIKQIEDINQNEIVIGKEGKFQQITKTFERHYKGEMFTICPHYLFPFKLTPEHRILVIKKQVCSWKNRLIACRPNCQEQKHGFKKNYKDYKLEWVPSRDLEKGDFILFPKFKEVQESKINLKNFSPSKEIEIINGKIRTCNKLKGAFKGKFVNHFIELSDEFFELCGWYLAEGSVDKKSDIRFSLRYKEKKEAERIRELIKYVFGIDAKINSYPNKGITVIRTSSNIVANFLRQSFNIKSTNKNIPSFIMLGKPEKIKHFINAYIQGDGHKCKKNTFTIVTASKNISYQIILLLSKINILPSVGKYENKGLGKTQYRIAIYGKQINNLEKNIHKAKTNHQRFFEDEKFFYIPLKKIEKSMYSGTVFNLETPDNTYLSSAIVHNCEYKYDGFRLIIHKKENQVYLFTRSLENVTKQFPEVIGYIQKYVKGKSFILDTEAVGFNKKTKEYKPFQDISQRIRRKYHIEKLQEDLPVEINVFDIIYYNGKTLLDEPFEKRTALIKKIVEKQPYKIICAKQIITDDEKKAEEFYNRSLKDHQEGVMMKSLQAKYNPGSRVGHMLKMKPNERELDVVIVGGEYGAGKRSGWLSSFTVACFDKKTSKFLEVGKVGTGIKEKQGGGVSFEELTNKLLKLKISEQGKEIKVKPKIIVTLTYQELQRSPTYNSGFALRFPRVTALREDKPLSEINTLEEIKEDFKKQNRNAEWRY